MKLKIWLIPALLFLSSGLTHAQVLATIAYQGLNSVAAQTGINLSGSPVNIHKILFRPAGTVTTCTVALDTSADGVTWNAGAAIAGTTCTSNGEATSASPVEANFVRVNLTAFSGTGSVNVVYSGLSTLTASVVTTVGGSPSGTTASGNPNLIAGLDPSTGFAKTIETDTSGIIATAAQLNVADGNNNGNGGAPRAAGNGGILALDIYALRFNGVSWDRWIYCNKTANITGLAATTTQIVAAVASQKIRVCNVVLSNNSATAMSVKFVEGTGANCATGQTNLTGTILLNANTLAGDVQAISLGDGGPWITNVTSDALCATGSAAGSTDITITYEQH